jgi:hypothetical protein
MLPLFLLFGIIKAMQMDYFYYHRTIAFKSLRRHIGNALSRCALS